MLRVISEKLKFDSSNLLRDAWRDCVREERDKQNINFDLENDESVGNVRRISVPSYSDIRENDTYYVQLQSAGGDWEYPIYYFRIQVKDGWHNKHMFVFIPSKKQGNGNLEKTDKGWAAIYNDTKHDDAREEKKAWDAVKDFLKDWARKEMAATK